MPVQENNHQQRKIINYKSLLNIFLIIVKELFVFALILYLILFILENFFPGFVSNNFSLNYVLFTVIGLGVISAFAPEEAKEEERKEKPKIVDYFMVFFLGVIGGTLIYFKINTDWLLRIIIAAIASLLIMAVSFFLLVVKDEEIEQKEEEIEAYVKEKFAPEKSLTTIIAFFRLLFFKKVNFPVFLILLVFLAAIYSFPKILLKEAEKVDLSQVEKLLKTQQAEETLTPVLSPVEEKFMAKPSSEIMIKVLNGSREEGVAQNFVQLLHDSGFEKAFFSSAPNANYENATIQSMPADRDQVDLVANLLKESYAIISFAPPVATKSGEITVILGNKVQY